MGQAELPTTLIYPLIYGIARTWRKYVRIEGCGCERKGSQQVHSRRRARPSQITFPSGFTCSCPLTQDCINILPASQYFVKGGPSSPRANKSRYLQPSNSLADAVQSMAVHHQWNSYSAPKNALSRSGHRKEFLDLIKREVTNPIGKGEGGQKS